MRCSPGGLGLIRGLLVAVLLERRVRGGRSVNGSMMRRPRGGGERGGPERRESESQEGCNRGVQTHPDVERRGTPEHLLPYWDCSLRVSDEAGSVYF